LKPGFAVDFHGAVLVRARVPEKQGLKPVEMGDVLLVIDASGREFQKNKD